ncbi:biotin-dependent carboxyltransferase family protein [Butyrivibrio sp. VCD2006]|uniref:5-oxoprolinase subunit C family protein n=1 Tax=Butyrivibrio sp. VCD2006 TaxID=1280664 RepID=UPI0004099384|nr:biotin-dependent carboxyltransferase family protein [Butyrivibrio sp. VCD2006]
MSIRIVNPGAMTTVQDEGRFGYMDSGISESGAMDKYSYRKANYLVGNKKDEAALEITLMGPELIFLSDNVFGYMGAEMEATLDGEDVLRGRTYLAREGQTLKFGFAKNGIRAYLAFAGGVDVPVVLGSRSTNIKCSIGGFEGRKLQAGDVLEIGPSRYLNHGVNRLLKRRAEQKIYQSEIQVRVILGPQDDYFTENGLLDFLNGSYKVSTDIDRMGIRLEGKTIEAKAPTDIVSDGITFGSIQITSSGMPIILMADHQTTGGYAKIATVVSEDLQYLAQARPGDVIRFQKVDITDVQKWNYFDFLTSIYESNPGLEMIYYPEAVHAR